jgi:8-oxo-dGTP diphosphatase
MNAELYDKKYPIPLPIVKELKSKLMSADDLSGEGVKRAKFLVNNGYATYQMMKRIKNFFDNFDQTSDSLQEYELSGGDNMRTFIDHTLDSDRSNVQRSKEIKRPLKPNTSRGIKATPPSMGESTIRIKKLIKEEEEKKLTINGLAAIFNGQNRILLLRRSSYPDQWMPNKWCMPGGMVEDGEKPIEGCIREIKEETGLDVPNLLEKAVIQREDNVEHLFTARYDGDPDNVTLSKESQDYGWYGPREIEFLDTVPNVMDYINIAIKDYE